MKLVIYVVVFFVSVGASFLFLEKKFSTENLVGLAATENLNDKVVKTKQKNGRMISSLENSSDSSELVRTMELASAKIKTQITQLSIDKKVDITRIVDEMKSPPIAGNLNQRWTYLLELVSLLQKDQSLSESVKLILEKELQYADYSALVASSDEENALRLKILKLALQVSTELEGSNEFALKNFCTALGFQKNEHLKIYLIDHFKAMKPMLGKEVDNCSKDKKTEHEVVEI